MIRKHTDYNFRPIGPRCKVTGCDETARRVQSTLCNKHDSRIKKYGDPNAMHLLKKGERPK